MLLLDVDPRSPERGRLIPTVAGTLAADEYLPRNVLAVAARPGFVLHPERTYAFVVTDALRDASGRAARWRPRRSRGCWPARRRRRVRAGPRRRRCTAPCATRAPLSFLHPALALLETAWEAAEPLVYMPRLARRPLPGHPVRPVYEPVGLDDSYFPPTVLDAVALAYGHRQAGAVVWPTMQGALALDGLDGLVPYPVRDNLQSADGTRYTGVVVQYAGDGVFDPHAIYSQLDAVK